jgi:Spy/CpxP family protein refolding chaperone
MKTMLFLSLLLLTAVAPAGLAAADGATGIFTQAGVNSSSRRLTTQLPRMCQQVPPRCRTIRRKCDAARIPDVEATPNSTPDSEVVMVALPFSSLQINPSLAGYLSLTSSQVEAIQQVMMGEQHSLEPLMTELRTARVKLLAIGSEHVNEKELKGLANKEASFLARLIVANARMQSKIYKILSSKQQKKLSDLERTQGADTSDSR